ncbi:MAG: class I SAM-dependent methyltransferase [Syntrophales bacterium]
MIRHPSGEEGDRGRSSGLREFILSRIRQEGPVPFARFMEWCLYHPAHGYYRSDRTRVGREGDYYTAPSVHPLFGRMVARQLMQMSDLLETERFTVVETGAGRGFLALDILEWARGSAPAFYRRLDYRLADISLPAVEQQKDLLARYAAEGTVSWEEEGEGGAIDGCFLSNELVDAFPVHRVVLRDGSLREVYVGERDGCFSDVIGDLSEPELAGYFPAAGIELAEGQQAEVNLRAGEWIAEVGRRLRRGFALTIDYGELARELYAPWRRAGTLRCYWRHRLAANPYERVGEQDITSHVDFSRLIRQGEAAGLAFTGLVPQYRFLIGLGLLGEMEAAGRAMSTAEGLKMRLSLKHLIEPGVGMGEIFKVLVQHKGVDEPRLDGLQALRAVPAPG